jgi:hypothetical protein
MKELIEGPLRRTAEGYEVLVRFDWYRALPLSGVSITLIVDGNAVPDDQLRFHINDRDYALDELPDLYEEFWFVLDAARLRVTPSDPLLVGEHEIDITVGLRIPYLFDEETGEVLTLYSNPRATLPIA